MRKFTVLLIVLIYPVLLFPENQQLQFHAPQTYTDIIQFLDDLESGKLEKNLPESELYKVNEYLVYLASEGILLHDDQLALRDDIEVLLSPTNYTFASCIYDSGFEYHTGAHHDIVECKNVFKKAWDKTKKFARKHKKELLIGAAVVVVATVVIVAVATAGTGTAAAGALAAVVASTEKELESATVSENDPPISVPDIHRVAMTIDDHLPSFKEFLSQDELIQEATLSKGWEELGFTEKVQETGASFAHKAFDEISDFGRVIPQLCEEIKDISTKFLPESLHLPDSEKSVDNFENLIMKGHQAIDKAFATGQADSYSIESKANDPMKDFAIGIIPLPGLISKNGSINVKQLSKLGKMPDRAGYTKAGRGTMKHGYREGRTVFKKPVGNPAQINEHGQKVLEKILNHPDKVVKQYTSRKFGEVIEIEAPDLGGVRYTGDGKKMIGFIEPYWLKK